MTIGISTFAWTASFELSHLHLLPRIRNYGFTALEIPMFDPALLPVKALRKELDVNSLECTICAILPEGVNPISPDAATRKISWTHLANCIETAAELGASLVGGPLFAPIGYLPQHRRTPDEWTWAVEALESVTPLLDKYAITLSIEPINRSETFFLRTAEEARSLCEAIAHPHVGVTLDTFHANIEEKSISGALRSLGPWLKHLHASENDRGLLGSGHIDFRDILNALRETGYEGYLMIEGFGFSESEANAPGALWADMRTSPDDVAVKGRDYLHSLLMCSR